MTTDVEARTRRARIATFAAFAVNGLIMATWVISIPSIQDRTGVSHGMLGGLLLVLGGGAFVGMQFCGWLADKLGSRHTVLGSAVTLAAVAVLPGLATSPLALGAALLVFGIALGGMDVAMNAHAVVVERRYPRPIMAAFHAFYSIGGALGSLLGAGLLALDWASWEVLAAGSAVGIVTTVAMRGSLLPRSAEGTASAATTEDAIPESTTARAPWWRLPRAIWLLGGAAFLLMLAEGVANDWSALQLTERFEVPGSVAALGYGAFTVSMTAGRLLTDRVVVKVGPARVISYGALIASSGLALIVLSPALWLSVAGWSVLGLGLSGGVPQLFTAAGNLTAGASGVTMSRVVGMGYLGQLAGPALIGAAASHVALTTALMLPALGCLAVVVGSTAIAPSLRSGSGPGTAQE